MQSGDEHGAVLQNVTYARAERLIIPDLSLNLTEDRIGIVGRNGSGKSTLARLICGLAAPDQGQVRVDGIDVVKDRAKAIRSVGILFQNPDHQIIFPTVEEEIAFGITQLGETKQTARAAAHQVLARFGKQDWAERSIHAMSQGQRHLVCLMAVLVMQPRLIVLDEPYAGLDIPTTRLLNRYLRGLDQRLLHITHDPSALAGYDRVVWIESGQVQMDGPAEPVLDAFSEAMIKLGESDDFTDFTD